MPDRGEEDKRLWREYKQLKKQGNQHMAKQKARELYGKMKGLIHGYTRRYGGYGLPQVAVDSKAREQFKKALDTYDPSFNTKLSTHVMTYLKGVNNYVKDYKDVARIPRGRNDQIHNFSKVKSDLEVRYGREPSNQELAEELKWSARDVENMEDSLRKEFGDTGLQEAGLSLDFDQDSRTKETIDLVYMSLGGDEQAVMEHLIGYGGKRKLNGKQISAKLNLSPSKVSRIRTKIADKIKEYN